MQGKIETINYKGQPIGRGYVLGKRKYHWLLKRKYEPCWAKNGKFVSELSPQKKDFTIYIPAELIKPGVYTIQDNESRKQIKVTEVHKNFFEYELIEEVKKCQNKKPLISAVTLDPVVGF